MTKDEFISREVSVWGEDYIFDLIDCGYKPAQLEMFGKLQWWWVKDKTAEIADLTQAEACATMPESRSVVSPVSTD